MTITRRRFLATAGTAAAAAAVPASLSALPLGRVAPRSPFKLAVITDEIGQDLARAAEIAANDFGMTWVELREVWSKNILRLDENEVQEARRILARFKLGVTAIASPLFKVDWPGAPRSKYSPVGDRFKADFTYEQQDEVLERSLALCRAFGTDHLRCFDFWRLENAAPYRAAIDEKLRQAAARAGGRNVTLVLENEHACNTATAAESVRTLAAVRSPFFKLNWDPGNAAFHGESVFPEGYASLPKDRIGHVHVKDALRKADGSWEWAAMGEGTIDWTGQFRALLRDGYTGPVVLETHWRGAGTPEASSRQCWKAMSRQLRDAGAL